METTRAEIGMAPIRSPIDGGKELPSGSFKKKGNLLFGLLPRPFRGQDLSYQLKSCLQ